LVLSTLIGPDFGGLFSGNALECGQTHESPSWPRGFVADRESRLFTLPYDIMIRLAPHCVSLPDAVSGSQFVGFLEQAQLVELITQERSSWIGGFGEDFLHGAEL
jgi:hypothetical protein